MHKELLMHRMNKKTLLYIHGYGSDRNSRKLQQLKNYLGDQYNCFFLEWTVFSDIPFLLNLALQKYGNVENLVIVGDSTGANLAYQLRELRDRAGDKLILLSPLLNPNKRKREIPFPDEFCAHLRTVIHPVNALVIASKTDGVIDQQSLFGEADKKFTLMEVDDGHRLENFHEYLASLKMYISQKST